MSPSERRHGELAEKMRTILRHGPATATELAAAVHARRVTVESILREDGRFEAVRPPPGRKHNAKCWAVRDEHGTSRDRQSVPRRGDTRPRAPRRHPGQLRLPVESAEPEGK